MIVARIEELYAFALAVRDGNELCVRHGSNALRLAESRHALYMTAALQIEHFDRVVPQCRDIQTLSGDVDGEMVAAAFDGRKSNRADQVERCLTPHRLKGRG